MSFIVLHVTAFSPAKDILQAELGALGFEAFLDTEMGFEASIEEDQFNEEAVKERFEFYQESFEVSYRTEVVEKQNWNTLWESNYPYVEITKDCVIRAEFHQLETSYKYELIITPKMSFGTGHHDTTSLMLQSQMGIDHQNKSVLDLGSGTGVLAIMANKLGAQQIDASDIEEWAVLNAKENMELNGVNNVKVQQGTVREIELQEAYDIVLANINKNVLLDEIPLYEQVMHTGSLLLLSGFYQNDCDDISLVANGCGLKEVSRNIQNEWATLTFEKA